MSEADKIIKNLKNSGKKVEEFYVSNKTSDKNVANIEDDVKYVKEMLEIARIFFKAVKAETDYKNVDEIAFCNAIENILAEREQKDKRIQELEEETTKLKAHHVFTRNEATDEEKAELYDVIDKTLDTFLEKEKPIWQQEMKTDKMSLEEALNVVDSMYQDRYKIIRENDTIFVDRLKDVKFTNLEFASVILLREVQSLQSKLKKSITKQDIKDLIKNETIDISGFECIAVEDLEKIIGG